jgi:hypothetical protein
MPETDKIHQVMSGETEVLQFNPNKFDYRADDFEGKNTKHVYYTVIDPKLTLEGEKELPISLTNSGAIDELLMKRFKFIEIKRMGAHRNTKYTFTPIIGFPYPLFSHSIEY